MLYMRWNEKARELEGEMQPRNDAGRGERWADASCAASLESKAPPRHAIARYISIDDELYLPGAPAAETQMNGG